MKKIVFLLLCAPLTGCQSFSLNNFYSKNEEDITAYCKKIYPNKLFSDDIFKDCLIDGTEFFLRMRKKQQQQQMQMQMHMQQQQMQMQQQQMWMR